MVATSELIDLTINIQASAVRVQNFGTPAIAVYTTAFQGVQEFALDASGLTAMVTAGLPVTSMAYLGASALAAQTPSADTVKVFARRSSELNTFTLTPAAPRTGDVYSFAVAGTTVSYTANLTDGLTVAAVTAGLTAAATAASVTGVSDVTTHVLVSGLTVGNRLQLRSRTANLISHDTSTPVGEVVTYGGSIEIQPGDGGSIADGDYDLTIYDRTGTAHTASFTAASSTATLCVADWITDLGTVPGVTITGTTSLILSPTTTGDLVTVYAATTTGDSYTMTPSTYTVGRTIADDLAEAVTHDPDFYAFGIDSSQEDTVKLAAAWAAANKHPLFVDVHDDHAADSVVTTDVLSDIQATTNHYCVIRPSFDCGGYSALGLASQALANDPGTITLANKSISGAEVDKWTGAQVAALQAKGGICYSPMGNTGLNMTLDGWAVSGRFFDLTHGTDWVSANLEADIIRHLAANPRVPFTQGGLDSIASVIYARLLSASGDEGDSGIFIAGPQPPDGEGPYVVTPAIEDVPANDRANRFADGFRFYATFQGAVHRIGVTGNLSTGG